MPVRPDPLRAFDLHQPEQRLTPFVFASPHSGHHYPPSLARRTILSARQLRSSEDAFVDRLFASAPSQGAPLLAAHLPRAWLDVNRAADELDPALIEGQRRGAHNPRVASGLGVIPRVVSGGRPIYSGKLRRTEVQERIENTWHPYHAALEALMADSCDQMGQAILLDCHSMPHEALDQVRVRGRRPDVVLGDRFGASASDDVTALVESEFTRAGFTVSRNAPFAGAYIAQHYGRPEVGRHVVQIELDRSCYMDEAAIAPHGGFDEVRDRIAQVIARLCGADMSGAALAAE
ncbi:N-formylglutamate amidohydrolase [Rhodobacteraceae bacterium THAF1]|uniref:N-formylglutamate amidohydrolase n=1 Tax=Palleronia sp. THAF1 TaxID=2587842 RepID=UPI000F40806A|nr:N-formylglutamate amidohydrolase [Palleronia sp. THAF1]QFU09638.1 N-formylglutamate amidohydrolase [Palleronia sp. THAF1]VDC17461.1 N-formylglutamate amidohydrolase [Rhodobacteraceae bacterium THAF1]